MRNLSILFALCLISACNSGISNNNDKGLQIDIYKSDMTFQEFKQKVIEYAEEATYPSLTNK